MPEGDTIHRAVASLRAALVGRALLRVELPRRPPPWPAVGATVTAVEARGKHLLVATSDGLTVHTHQRMTGSWHLYGPADRWRKSARAAVVVLAVRGVVAVCFASPVVEVLDAHGLRRHPTLRRLGPDLCDPAVDLDDVVRRLEEVAPDRTIGETLLDQRVACGIGNVYRCDVLFLHGLHPGTPVAAVDGTTRRALFTTASTLLQRNLGGAARRSTTEAGAPGALLVYGRDGQPCRTCGAAISVGRLGDQARVVYWCSVCQPAARPRGAGGRSVPGRQAPR